MIKLTERQLRKTVRHILQEVEISPLPIDILSIGMPEEEEEEVVVWDMTIPPEPEETIELSELISDNVFDTQQLDSDIGQENTYSKKHVEDSGRMLDYGEHKSDSHEGRMSKAKLHRMAKMSQSLKDRLGDGDDLPGWVQDKITTAEDRLKSAYDYLDYKIHRMENQGVPCNESTARKIARKYFKSNL